MLFQFEAKATLLMTLIFIASCQVESPKMDNSDVPNAVNVSDEVESSIETAVKNKLNKVNPTLGLMSNLINFSQNAEVLSSASSQTPVVSDLFEETGKLMSYDEESGYFEFDLTSQATLELASPGASVKFFLSGFIKEREGESVVVKSEIFARYITIDGEQTFRMMSESGSDDDSSVFELTIKISEVVRFFTAMAGNDSESIDDSYGDLVVFVSEEGYYVKGEDVNIIGPDFTIQMTSMKFGNLNDNDSREDDAIRIRAEGTILNHHSAEVVGFISIVSVIEDGSQKYVVKIEYDN